MGIHARVSLAEASKLVMTYVAAVCGEGERVNSVKEQLLQSNPVLEGEKSSLCPIHPHPTLPSPVFPTWLFLLSLRNLRSASWLEGLPPSPALESLFLPQPSYSPSPHLRSFWQCQDHSQQQLLSICE